MSQIIDEFEPFLEDDEPIEADFESNSKHLIEQAKNIRALETIYGINALTVYKQLTFGKTSYIPWDHVTLYMDTNKLLDINGELITELRIFNFVEEVAIGSNTDIGFGFNNSYRNRLKVITIPENVIVLDNKIFAFYKNLKSITFESNSKLLRLGNEAFAYCENLHTLDLRNCTELDELPDNFIEYSGVSVLKLSSNLKRVSRNAFSQADLKCIYIDDDKYTFDMFMKELINNNFNSFWGVLNTFDF